MFVDIWGVKSAVGFDITDRVEERPRDIVKKSHVGFVLFVVIVDAGIDQVVGLALEWTGITRKANGCPLRNGSVWHLNLTFDLAEIKGKGEIFQIS